MNVLYGRDSAVDGSRFRFPCPSSSLARWPHLRTITVPYLPYFNLFGGHQLTDWPSARLQTGPRDECIFISVYFPSLIGPAPFLPFIGYFFIPSLFSLFPHPVGDHH